MVFLKKKKHLHACLGLGEKVESLVFSLNLNPISIIIIIIIIINKINK